MDYVGCTLLNANSWLPLNGKKRILRTKYFQQYFPDAIVIQAENNNISLTEFSNVSGYFMDVNTRQMYFSFSYETTVEPLRMDTSLIHTILYYRHCSFQCPDKIFIIFSKKEPQ